MFNYKIVFILLLPTIIFFASVVKGQNENSDSKDNLLKSIPPKKQGYLGIETSSPTPEEAKKLELPLNTRYQGQIIKTIDKNSPAERMNLKIGDVILKINENALFSQDDFLDFLFTMNSDTPIVKLLIKHRETLKEEEMILEMETQSRSTSFLWEYAGLAQLPLALKVAKKTGKNVLVGLSGAET